LPEEKVEFINGKQVVSNQYFFRVLEVNGLGKGTAITVHTWTGCWGSMSLRLPEFIENRHMNLSIFSTLAPAVFTPPSPIGDIFVPISVTD
jgi:hypothetical protein